MDNDGAVSSSQATKRRASDGDCRIEEKASDGEREAYYSANFKEILRAVLNSSPEKHVLSDQATKTANRFFELTGTWLHPPMHSMRDKFIANHICCAAVSRPSSPTVT